MIKFITILRKAVLIRIHLLNLVRVITTLTQMLKRRIKQARGSQ